MEKTTITGGVFASLCRIVDALELRPPDFSSDDPVLSTPFRVASAAAAALGLGASGAGEIWRLRGGSEQQSTVDLRAAAASLVSFALLRLNGNIVPRPAEANPTVAMYRTKDGRFI